MPIHQLALSSSGPFEGDADARVIEFFEANGYTQDAETRLFMRGEEGAGWWTSEMSALKTTVEIILSNDSIRVNYKIDIEGQRLSEEDRKFWPREAEHMFGYLRGGQLFDLRHAEQLRASRTRGSSVRLSMTLGFAIFCIIIVLHFLDLI